MRDGIRFSVWLVAASLAVAGCDPRGTGVPLPAKQSFGGPPNGSRLLCRLAHITDAHAVDEESPARLSGADSLVSVAWRSQEAYSTQLLDGMVRAINRYHREVAPIDVVIHTGDAVDNSQFNELRWFIDVMDGGVIDPLSGIDDRDPADVPPANLDPHAPFEARGLGGSGIPWLNVYGNHDAYAVGVFPTVAGEDGRLVAPLPLDFGQGILLPLRLDPVGDLAYGFVTPANPGPPSFLNFPVMIPANPDRRFVTKADFILEHFKTTTEPIGHGFSSSRPERAYYSYELGSGLRLIVLDTTDVPDPVAGGFYFDGAISQAQLDWFRDQLAIAKADGERVIVASHHPSTALRRSYGSAILPDDFQDLLRANPHVILHLVGHTHRHRVLNRGSYLEIETASVIDFPQEGRIIEIYEDEQTGEIAIQYAVFSHLNDTDDDPDDPLAGLRREAFRRSATDIGLFISVLARQARDEESVLNQAYFRGEADDRQGRITLKPAR